MSQFWAWIAHLMSLGGCEAVTQSTHGIPATENAVVYGGNCVEAWLISVTSFGHYIAWIVNS